MYMVLLIMLSMNFMATVLSVFCLYFVSCLLAAQSVP